MTSKMKKAMIAPLVGAMLCGSVLCFTPKTEGVSYAAPTSYESLVNVKTQGSGLRIEPSIVFAAKSSADLTSVVLKQPTTTLLEVDDSLNVKLTDGNKAFSEVFNNNLKGVTIPALRIETDAAATAFISFMKNTCYISDIMVVSSSKDILNKIYTDDVCFTAHGVYDVSSKTLSSNRYDFWEHIADANRVGANILLINGEDENASVAANYAAALNKVCWGAVSGEKQAIGAVAGGCYGLVGSNVTDLQNAVKKFTASGFAQAQSIAAHRGITKYANENSLTSCAAAANEGSTHIEIDVQVTGDGEIVLCHNSDAGVTSTAANNTWFAIKDSETLRSETLIDYDEAYGETFATLDELIEVMLPTDVIFIVELKIDGASDVALEKKPIEKIYETFNKYEEMTGRWLTITFYGSYAKKMREVCPEIPVCALGFAEETGKTVNWDTVPKPQVSDVEGQLLFNRRLNVGLDYNAVLATYSTVYTYATRGYLQNTWTYEATQHLGYGVNIATTNAAEEMAMEVKEVGIGTIELTADQLKEDAQVKLPCRTYNGFVKEETCTVIYTDGEVASGNTVNALFFYGKSGYGLYSNLLKVKVK